jgi:hypothetical protein
MRAHEIFQNMSLALSAEIFGYLQREERPVLKAATQGLAQQRKLRAVFVERKPPNERFAWLRNAVSNKISDLYAQHLLRAWLAGAHKQMLCDFLDSLGVEHDDEGMSAQLPDSPPKEKLAEALAQLLAKYPAEAVAVYLQAFHDLEGEATWPPLGELLREDDRLKLGAR